MKKTTRASLALVVGLGMACGGGGGSSTTAPDKAPQGPNLNPTIQRVALDPPTVPWGGTATITVTAVDPEGQRLTYRYLAAQGTVTPDSANPARATYTHNGQARPDRVEVTVTDERNGTAQAASDIAISAPPTPAPPTPPSTPPTQPPPQPPVTAAPTVSVSASPSSCHPPCDVTFTADANGAESYAWSGCAGPADRGSRSVKCTLSRLNTVSATCTVSNGAGSASASASASGTNGAPAVVGGSIIKAISADLTGQYQDPDKDSMECGWRKIGNGCEPVGGCEDFRGTGGSVTCKARMPIGGTFCEMALECNDGLGGSGRTQWRLELP